MSEFRTRQFLTRLDQPGQDNEFTLRSANKRAHQQTSTHTLDLPVPSLSVGRSTSSKLHSFNQFMCYSVRVEDKLHLQLRSNRTIEAHRQYRGHISRLTLVLTSLAGIMVLFLGTPIAVFALLDSRYLNDYPDCDPQMERLLAAGQFHKWSMTPTWGH